MIGSYAPYASTDWLDGSTHTSVSAVPRRNPSRIPTNVAAARIARL